MAGRVAVAQGLLAALLVLAILGLAPVLDAAGGVAAAGGLARWSMALWGLPLILGLLVPLGWFAIATWVIVGAFRQLACDGDAQDSYLWALVLLAPMGGISGSAAQSGIAVEIAWALPGVVAVAAVFVAPRRKAAPRTRATGDEA